MEIVYVYQKQRKEFGRAPKFVDVEPETLSETVPNPDLVNLPMHECLRTCRQF